MMRTDKEVINLLLKIMKLNKQEIEEILWCMETMEPQYHSGTLEYSDFKHAQLKLEDELERLTLK